MINRIVLGWSAAAIAVCGWTLVHAADHPGESLYAANCRRCHGAEARGGQGPSLVPFRWTDAEALQLVRHPLCDMPAFPESALSDADVAQIAAFLRTIH